MLVFLCYDSLFLFKVACMLQRLESGVEACDSSAAAAEKYSGAHSWSHYAWFHVTMLGYQSYWNQTNMVPCTAIDSYPLNSITVLMQCCAWTKIPALQQDRWVLMTAAVMCVWSFLLWSQSGCLSNSVRQCCSLSSFPFGINYRSLCIWSEVWFINYLVLCAVL